jgi:hypothetical protein
MNGIVAQELRPLFQVIRVAFAPYDHASQSEESSRSRCGDEQPCQHPADPAEAVQDDILGLLGSAIRVEELSAEFRSDKLPRRLKSRPEVLIAQRHLAKIDTAQPKPHRADDAEKFLVNREIEIVLADHVAFADDLHDGQRGFIDQRLSKHLDLDPLPVPQLATSGII